MTDDDVENLHQMFILLDAYDIVICFESEKKYKNHSILCWYIVPSGIYLSVNIKKTCTSVPFETNFTTF